MSRRGPRPRETLGPGLRTAILARQSASRGDGADSLSIGSMVRELTERCRREQWPIVRVLEAPDVKGWADEDDRPDIQDAFALAEAGAIDLLLIWKGDRFARSVALQEAWVRRFLALGVEVESHTEPAWRTTRLVRVLLGAVAEQQTDDIAAHVSRALAERAQRGLPHGRAPWGYLRAEPNGPLVPDPQTAPIVRALFEARASGASTRDIGLLAIHLCDQAAVRGPGLGGWNWTTVASLLRNPAYRGAVRFGAVVREDAHPAIVEPALWGEAQAEPRLKRRRSDPALSWLAGLVDHACGGAMYLQGPDGKTHLEPWLCCPRLGRGGQAKTCFVHPAQVQTPRLERMTWDALAVLLTRLLDPEQVVRDAKAELAQHGPAAAKARAAAERAAQRATERRERALELYLAGAIDRTRFDAETTRADAESAAAAADLARMPAAVSLETAATTHAMLNDLHDVLAAAGSSPRAGEVLRRVGRAKLMPAVGADPAKRNPGRIVIVPHPALARFLARAPE